MARGHKDGLPSYADVFYRDVDKPSAPVVRAFAPWYQFMRLHLYRCIPDSAMAKSEEVTMRNVNAWSFTYLTRVSGPTYGCVPDSSGPPPYVYGTSVVQVYAVDVDMLAAASGFCSGTEASKRKYGADWPGELTSAARQEDPVRGTAETSRCL